MKLNYFISVQFSCSFVSDSLQPHGLQHARLPCPSPTPRACSNSCPSSQWCHPTISSSVFPFSSRLQSFLPSGAFPRVSSSHQVAKVLKLQLQHQSFQWIFRTDFYFRKRAINRICVACVLSLFSLVWLFATLWTVTLQDPLSMDFPDKNTGVSCHALL